VIRAGFNNKFARLFFERCSPAASALFYYDQRVVSEGPDEWLEKQFADRRDAVLPVILAAALGAESHDLLYSQSHLAEELYRKIASTHDAKLLRAAAKNIWPSRDKPLTTPAAKK
jgi:hypothetical protein